MSKGRKLVVCVVLLISLLTIAQPKFVEGTPAAQPACDLEMIVADVGRYHLLAGTDQEPRVFLMQDHHGLVSGRIESAVMLHRLARECGVEMLGLEGLFPEEHIELSWLDGMPSVHVNHNTAVELLAEGEINQGELVIVTHRAPYTLTVAHIGLMTKRNMSDPLHLRMHRLPKSLCTTPRWDRLSKIILLCNAC